MIELRGRSAVVTGAASGIGLGIAETLAAEGVNVVIADIREDAAKDVASDLSTRFAVKACGLQVDVSDREAVYRLAAASRQALGPISILVNNAGIGVLGVDLDEMQNRDVERMIGVNITGVVNGVRAFVPQLRDHGGHIVNVSSIGGLHVMPGWRYALYAATKAAVVSLSEGLRDDLAEAGVGVSVLCPGGVRTAIHNEASTSPDHENHAAVAGGMDPLRVGQFVVQGIRENQFLILTHPELRHWVERRHKIFMAAFDTAEKTARSLDADAESPLDRDYVRGRS
jgi:short-subunit dehydrogenase